MSLQLRIRGPGLAITRQLAQGVTTIGRQRLPSDDVNAPDADIRIDTAQLLQRHIRIEVRGDEYWVTDLGSAYGTRHNGKRLAPWTPTRVTAGDRLEIGLDYQVDFESIAARPQDSRPLTGARYDTVPDPEQRKLIPYDGIVPPGLRRHSLRLLQYLPNVYQPPAGNGYWSDAAAYDSADNFMTRFLAIFESILLPAEWTVANFDLFLQLATAPDEFLPWFDQWFSLSFDSTWSNEQRRKMLARATDLFALRGTRAAMSEALEIYTGKTPDIVEDWEGPLPYVFRVFWSPADHLVNPTVVRQIVDLFTPAHMLCVEVTAKDTSSTSQ